MYKFTNGFIVYDEEIKDKFLQFGYKLVEEQEKPIEEEANGNQTDNSGVVEEQHSRSNKKTSKSK